MLKDILLAPFKRQTGARLEYMDLAKGIAMIMVIGVHCCTFFPMYTFLALPMFFVVAGYFFKDEGFKTTMAKKAQRLLVPAVIFNVIGAFYFYMERRLFTTETDVKLNLLGSVFLIDLPNGSVWFLLVLFFDVAIFMLILRAGRNEMQNFALVMAFLAIGVLLDWTRPNPLHLRSTLIALPFFYMGYLLKKYDIIERLSRVKYYFWIALTIIVVLYIIFHEHGLTSMIMGDATWKMPLYIVYPATILNVLCALLIFRRIGWLPLISFFGVESMVIVCIHIFFVNFTGHVGGALHLPETMTTILIWVAITLGCMICAPLLNRYLPFAVGKSPKKKP